MAKPLSELTIAIRQLCDETDGKMTHAESRERLPEMGHPVVPEPGRISPELSQWAEYEVNHEDAESVSATAEACGFDDATVKSVLNEHKMRKAFDKEGNNFNVGKQNWKKAKASGKPSVSRKPASARNTKSRVAAAATASKPMDGDTDKALVAVKKRGGLAKCQEKLENLGTRVERLTREIAERQERLDRATVEIEELKVLVEVVAELEKRLKAAA